MPLGIFRRNRNRSSDETEPEVTEPLNDEEVEVYNLENARRVERELRNHIEAEARTRGLIGLSRDDDPEDTISTVGRNTISPDTVGSVMGEHRHIEESRHTIRHLYADEEPNSRREDSYGRSTDSIHVDESVSSVSVRDESVSSVTEAQPDTKNPKFTKTQMELIKKASKVLSKDLFKYGIKPRGDNQVELEYITLYQSDFLKLAEYKELVTFFDHGKMVFSI